MDCEKALELMSAELDGMCTEQERAALQAHLEACADCRETYRRLHALDETRNITHAADKLYMTQSALSKRIKALEQELKALKKQLPKAKSANPSAFTTNVRTGEVRSPFPDFDPCSCKRLSFCGVQILSDRVLRMMEAWPEKFSIIDFYLAACAWENIRGVVAKSLRIIDIGTPDKLAEADRLVCGGAF